MSTLGVVGMSKNVRQQSPEAPKPSKNKPMEPKNEPTTLQRSSDNTPQQAVSDNQRVRELDMQKLKEIIADAAMYRASLVEACRHEVELREKSKAFARQVSKMDKAKLREVVANPQLYAEELVYACEQEQAERRRIWYEQQKHKAERIRLERERKAEEVRQTQVQQGKEAPEQHGAVRKKRRPYVFAMVAILVLAGIGIGGYTYYKEQQNRLEQERIAAEMRRIMEEHRVEEQRIAKEKAAEEKRREQQRIAAQKAAEQQRIAEEKAAEEKRIAEEKIAEERRIAAEKAAEEQRIAEQKRAEEQRVLAEQQRIAAEKEYRKRQLAEQQARQNRLSQYKEGDLFVSEDGKGVVIRHNAQGMLVIGMSDKFGSWPGYYANAKGWRLPTREELRYIQSNKTKINQYLSNNKGGQIRSGVYYWSATTGYRSNERIASNGSEISRDHSNKNYIRLVQSF